MRGVKHLSGSLRTSTFRLSLVYSLLFTVGVGLLLGATYLIAARTLQSQSDNVILIELGALADEYDRGGESGVVAALNRLRAGWERAGAVYLLVNRDFEKRAGNLEAWPFDGLPADFWLEFEIDSRHAGETSRHPVRAHIFNLADGYLLVGTEISQGRRFQQAFRQATLWGIGSTALLGALLGLWLSRKLVSRVRAVSVECEHIVAGDLSRRLPVSDANDEFDALSAAVNRVLARLDEQTGILRATFDSTAHDLRAPLARLRGRLEELQRTARLEESIAAGIDRALQDIDAVQKTLTTLLQIAQAEARVPLGDEDQVNLGALAQEIGSLYEPVVQQRGMKMNIDVRDSFVRGSRQLLAQLISNLVENAIKHATAGGSVELAVRTTSAEVVLELGDRGGGIAAEDRERALRPFVRLNSTSSPGSGLGLSLVAAIARLHAARLYLEDNAPGLLVSVRFNTSGLVAADARGGLG